MCKKLVCFVLVLGCLCILNAPALAVTIMTTNDTTVPTSSFNNAGKWNDGLAPYAGNTYSTVGYLVRSPVVGTAYQSGDWTFAGDSLTVGGGNGGGSADNTWRTDGVVNNNSLIFKANNLNLTVNNLILDAGTIRDGMGTNNTVSMNGNISVTANGGGFAAQCLLSINSVISGSGPIYIADNGSGEAGRTVFFTGLNTYNGDIHLVSKAGRVGSGYSRLTFADNSLMNFTIGASSGANNSVSGTGTATFNGDFNLDLTNASTTVGDSWTVASATTQTFSDTFTVIGFTDIGGGLWTKGTTYQFSESTGALTVIPEPATMVLLGLGSLALMRRRKS